MDSAIKTVASTDTLPRLRTRGTSEQRFVSKIRRDESGCWAWTGYVKPNGYGVFKPSKNERMYAHRWAYMHWVGLIHPGLVVDHICNVRNCVNPSHLRLLTPEENVRRGKLRLTHCKHDHEWTPANTRIDRHGHRVCRECRRLHQQRFRNGERSGTSGLVA